MPGMMKSDIADSALFSIQIAQNGFENHLDGATTNINFLSTNENFFCAFGRFTGGGCLGAKNF
jgi:hypothetical protein